jgi:NTE family protein
LRRISRAGPRNSSRLPAAWVLGGGAARGAAQVGTIRALIERGLAPPTAIFGTSVGALDGAVIAARPSLEGVGLLERLWLSSVARNVFRVHSMGLIRSRLTGQLGVLSSAPLERLIGEYQSATGCQTFDDLQIPLRVVSTDVLEGSSVLMGTGPLAPALLASASIPGVFPPVTIGHRMCADGGIVENLPITLAVDQGFARILAIDLMATLPLERPPASWSTMIARTLQLNLHHRLLSDFERLRKQAKIVVICPITPSELAWDMRRAHIKSLIERSYRSTSRFLDSMGNSLFERSAIHYLDLRTGAEYSTRTSWLAEAV